MAKIDQFKRDVFIKLVEAIGKLTQGPDGQRQDYHVMHKAITLLELIFNEVKEMED